VRECLRDGDAFLRIELERLGQQIHCEWVRVRKEFVQRALFASNGEIPDGIRLID
jgi:hypothetical protein